MEERVSEARVGIRLVKPSNNWKRDGIIIPELPEDVIVEAPVMFLTIITELEIVFLN